MKTNYNPVLLLQRYTLLEQYHEKYWIEYPIQDSIYLDSKYLIKTVIKQQKEDYLLLQTTQLLDSTGRQVLELKSYRVEFKNELQ
ncbi:MAG: hypothetical protein ACEPOV_14335 [Hyphomicrobiales bacterium]